MLHFHETIVLGAVVVAGGGELILLLSLDAQPCTAPVHRPPGALRTCAAEEKTLVGNCA